MQKCKRIILTIILPLILGGLIYILFRSDSLLMFQWFDYIGLQQSITTARQSFGHIYLPSWIIYSLPDALWIFSFISIMLTIWRDKFTRQSIFWIFIAPTIGILSEIGQAFHFIRGTFDIIDLTLILIASTIPFLILIKKSKTQIL